MKPEHLELLCRLRTLEIAGHHRAPGRGGPLVKVAEWTEVAMADDKEGYLRMMSSLSAPVLERLLA